MNIAQAKKIPIESFLDRIGHKPKSRRGSDLWYNSPLRNEDDTPSFKVNLILNTWYDFGLSEGGTIIDLVCLMYSDSVSGALQRLGSDFITRTSYTKPTIEIQKTYKKAFELVSSGDLREPVLLKYIGERCINPYIAKKFLKQVNFRYKGKPNIQYAIGFQSDGGGFEFRNSLMKGFLGDKKTITSLNIENGPRVVVFEGFFDFLSFLTEYNLTDFKSPAIILNSTSNWKSARDLISNQGFDQALFFLDNDETGKTTYSSFSDSLECSIVDKSTIYADHTDYNQYLMRKDK